MVTLSIAEKNGAIRMLTETAMQKKGIRFCGSRHRSDCDYIFLPPNSDASRDVLLLHDADVLPHGNADYVTLLNTDRKLSPAKQHALLVTYGLNPRATVTASSLRADSTQTEIFCCIQRSLISLKGRLIEPQEFSLLLPLPNADTQVALAFAALGLILSITPGEFAHILL